jgi:AcrR family transcriptional regulator
MYARPCAESPGTLYEMPSQSAPGPIWTRPAPAGRAARLGRDDIARAALAVADRDGFGAVSMRRLARELGVGTMSLYHYLRTKNDLLELMDDAVMGELLVPPQELPEGWREALTAIARRTRDAWARHPWAIDSLRGERFGPNAMAHVEQSLTAVASMRLTPVQRLEVIGIVDDYVMGCCISMTAGRSTFYEDDGGAAVYEAILDHVEDRLEQGDFPQTRALVGDGDVRANWERLAAQAAERDRFEVGLARLLDGVELAYVRGDPNS